MDLPFALLILGSSFAVSLLSGTLGIGGGIVLAPVLLYLPASLGLGALDMKQVSGLTITQGLSACVSGAFGHERWGHVHHRLVRWMGITLFLSALLGSLLSSRLSNAALMVVFAVLALAASALMCSPSTAHRDVPEAPACAFNVPLAVGIAAGVGLLSGLVGQGGSFILIPLMLALLKLPTRIVIGSNLALVIFSSTAGFVGKAATGQVPFAAAALLVIGALPGAQLGCALSHRTPPRWLRVALAFVISIAAIRVAIDAFHLEFGGG
jgi:uncharacterized membrane protein YfcA